MPWLFANATRRVYRCTDGIIEASDKDHEEFGADRLVEVIRKNHHLSALDIVKVVAREVTEYARGGIHIDDKVLMVVKVLDDLDPDTPAPNPKN